MSKEEPFKVGDRVAIIHRGAPIALTNIARVMSRFVETKDGSKFTKLGREYPHREWSMTSLEHATAQTIARLNRLVAIQKSRRVLQKLTDDEAITAAEAVMKLRNT